MEQLTYNQNLKEPLKYISMLGVLYTSFLLVASLLVHKIVIVEGFSISASTFVFPFTYFFGDVIAEVYGYKISRQLIWGAFVAMFIFDISSFFLIHLPSPLYWHQQQSYNVVVDPLPRVFLGDFIALNVGAFVNVYFITKWKVLLQGKYFWLRSLGATAIGEAVFNLLAFFMIFTGTIPFTDLLQAMLLSYFFKAIFAIVTVYPAVLLTRFLKRSERVDVYDYSTNFNPFKLNFAD